MEHCSICLNEVTTETNKMVTECNHTFHTNCYLNYCKVSRKIDCPNCRNPNKPITIKCETQYELGDVVLNRSVNNYGTNYKVLTVTKINDKSITCNLNLSEVFSENNYKHHYYWKLDEYNSEVKFRIPKTKMLHKYNLMNDEHILKKYFTHSIIYETNN